MEWMGLDEGGLDEGCSGLAPDAPSGLEHRQLITIHQIHSYTPMEIHHDR